MSRDKPRKTELQSRITQKVIEFDIPREANDEADAIRLSVDDQRALAEALINPPPLSSAIERVIERYRKIITVSAA